MGTWTSNATFDGSPSRIMRALTDVSAIEDWSPVPFTVSATASTRLHAGDRILVNGSLIGQSIRFAVEVDELTDGRLALRARGPFEMDVDYRIDPPARRVTASVQTRGGGLIGRALAGATQALLAAGALDQALTRILAHANA